MILVLAAEKRPFVPSAINLRPPESSKPTIPAPYKCRYTFRGAQKTSPTRRAQSKGERRIRPDLAHTKSGAPQKCRAAPPVSYVTIFIQLFFRKCGMLVTTRNRSLTSTSRKAVGRLTLSTITAKNAIGTCRHQVAINSIIMQ